MFELFKMHMTKLCPKCYYLGKGQKRFLDKIIPHGNYVVAASTLSYFLYRISFGVEKLEIDGPGTLATSIFTLLISTYSIALVILLILFSISGSKTCPKCSYKEMLPLDSPEAINLIKKYDLKVGENPSPSSQTEPSSSSLETPKL